MKPCTTCAYYHAFGAMKNQHYCLHPLNRNAVTGIGDGAFKPREENGVCGPDAHLHSSINQQYSAYLRSQ